MMTKMGFIFLLFGHSILLHAGLIIIYMLVTGMESRAAARTPSGS